MFNTPAGLTSSVTADDKKYILQTEFIVTPEPRIITTVIYQGQVIHKIERLYQALIDDVDSFTEAEKAVKNQHIAAARLIAARPRDYGAKPPEIQVSIEDRLRLISGVAEVTEINDELLAKFSAQSASANLILGHFNQLKDIAMGLSGSSRLGRLKQVVGALGSQKFIFTGFTGKTYLLGLKPDVDITRVLMEIESAGP